MARKRQATAPESEGAPILPMELLRRSLSADQSAAKWHAERRQWFRDHGVDVADFAAVRAMQSASEIAHGLPDSSALARARRRAEGGTTVTTIPTRTDAQRHLPAAEEGGE